MHRNIIFLIFLLLCLALSFVDCECGEESERIKHLEDPWDEFEEGSWATDDQCEWALDYLYEECEMDFDEDFEDVRARCLGVEHLEWRTCIYRSVSSLEGCYEQIKSAVQCDHKL